MFLYSHHTPLIFYSYKLTFVGIVLVGSPIGANVIVNPIKSPYSPPCIEVVTLLLNDITTPFESVSFQ